MENKYQLKKMAAEILRKAGYDASGRPRGSVPRGQYDFEYRMQTGAYSTNQSKCNRRYK